MAVNFLLSVRRHGRAKIMVVAMDVVTFDFMDAMDPGTAVQFPNKGAEPHQLAVRAGQWGDAIFKAETVVRPDILLSILRQGYKTLWTDVDIVWLGNPLPLLPDSDKNASAAEVLLQLDGKPINKCTCFMFMDTTPNAEELLERWKLQIVTTRAAQNQLAFQKPLNHMLAAGLRLDLLPAEVMPPGKKFFDNAYMKEHEEQYRGKLLIVHNNWIIGHGAKKERFRTHDLWEVENWEFPTCNRRRLRGREEGLSLNQC